MTCRSRHCTRCCTRCSRTSTLPAIQRRALEGALAVGPPAPVERLVVHAAVLGLVSAAAEQQPLLLLVADAHWLDEASAGALGFLARRLGAERTGLCWRRVPTSRRSWT